MPLAETRFPLSVRPLSRAVGAASRRLTYRTRVRPSAAPARAL
jgi:hypothetical protein